MKIGEYEVTAKLSQDSVYQWVEAVDKNQENQVILQLVQPEIPQEAIAQIITYFDKLQLIRRKGIWRPEQLFSDEQHPLIIVYPYIRTRPLKQTLSQTSLDEEALEWWHQASEALHALHNKDLVHGYININYFVISEKLLYLKGFGYAPLLKLGYKKFLQSERNVLAPEVLAQQQVTKAADIYAFAKTIATIYPQLIDTSWYAKATDPDPDKRFKRMRNLFDSLQKIVSKLLKSSSEEPDIQDIAEETKEYQEKIPESNIIPKYQLSVRVEPPEAGKVIGGGNYAVDKMVTITASKSAGWNFAHWTGDASGVDNQVTVKMDGDKSIVAHFTAEVKTKTEPKPEPKSPFKPQINTTVRLNLWVNAEPTGAGTIDGGGEYETGSSVKIRAWAANQLWRFDHWSGDLKGSENPAQLVMDANKKIQANFTKVQSKSSPLFPSPKTSSQTEEPAQQSNHEDNQKSTEPTQKKPPSRIPKWAQPDQ
ncbi:MAG: protein kinase [Cyanobacteria bacterium P01_F01_bin.143]